MAAAKKTAASTTTTKKKTGKTYYPPKTFDDDLASLVELYKNENWSFSGVDFTQLTKDAGNQRDERLAHDGLQIQFDKVHQQFGEAQEARYQRFAAALHAARGAFRNDKAVTAQLDKFKRSVTRKPKAPKDPKAT
jgi:hypothetical protein